MSISLFLIITCGVVAWVYHVLMTLQTWECVRFARSRRKSAATESPPTTADRVAVFVPCKGDGDDLVRNLQPLFCQDHPNYEVVFIVESPRDAAWPVLRRLIRDRHVDARVFVAGRAKESGQKVHNLLQATAELPDAIGVLAFMDSDACPGSQWLSQLVAGLAHPGSGAVTGYRWLVPKTNHLANLMLYSMNSALAGLMGPGGFNLVWGGSWAIRRETWQDTGLREAWFGTLSDDLVASRVLRGAGLRVRFEPNCVARSTLDTSWSQAAEFVRRQYLIGRRYATTLWHSTLAAQLASQIGLWGSLAYAIFGSRPGWRVATFASFCGLYAISMLRASLRQRLAAVYAPSDLDELTVARRFDIFASPLCGIVNAVAVGVSAFGSRITWRGIRYWISPGGRILSFGRIPDRSHEVQSDQDPVIIPFPTTEKTTNAKQRAA